MDNERIREICLGLPHVTEAVGWGHHLVFWVGDKAIGGKMFALLDLSGGQHGVGMYSAGPERFTELVEIEGMIPAPYMARIHWVAAERWGALRNSEWEEELRAAHAITLAKLPKGVLEVLAMPERGRKALIVERRKMLAAREEKARAAKAAKKASKVRRG